ncbi:universal stress protein [Methylibium sp.]|uniref:universal stress protein n=1 Tax=Methylibium sp. TaxID=2067992 RepID=UPI003D11A5B5
MKILAAVDGSSYTKRMLGYLTAQAEWLVAGHDITVLTVNAAVPPRAAAALDREMLQSYYEDEAEKVFKPIRSFFAKQGVTATFVRKTGHAAELIAKTAESGKFDLLLLGSHGHGALSGLVMGSVTAKVLASCRTPALLIR